jgi:hypothetical protein
MAKAKSPRKNATESIIGKETALPTNGGTTESMTGTATAEMSAAPSNGETKPNTKKITRKPEIVKPESRSNLFPINLEDEIRRLAYLIAERRGFEPGHETEDWLAAEHEVLQRYHHQQTA